MTYNVHSCVGRDNKTSPLRIAEVIVQYGSDIVALQEIDVGLLRSGQSDQARIIARQLNMYYNFHPGLQMEKGQYGNAILSRYPMRLQKAASLPTFPSRPPLERRGALWVEVKAFGPLIQVINTHLGLSRQERVLQAETRNLFSKCPSLFSGLGGFGGGLGGGGSFGGFGGLGGFLGGMGGLGGIGGFGGFGG